MQKVFARSPLPLLADESCRSLADVERCAGRFHGVNVKLAKCGGLDPGAADDRPRAATRLEGDDRLFHGIEREHSAAAQLLPLADYADLDGALLLANDVAAGVRIDRGRVVLPQGGGCGVELKG